MKLFACHLLLLPLLLLFCCHCLAAVHGKADDDNLHSIYKTNPRFNAMRTDVEVNKSSYDHFLTTNSSRADFPCPAAAAIAPCTCTLDSNNRVYIDCTFVESVDQLVEVFQQEFPVRELYRFSMANNSAINVFPIFMNGITFESVYLHPGPFVLSGISEHFLFDLKDTLKEVVIDNSKLTTDFFPFFILPFMNQLEDLRIIYSDISWIPPIRAPSLTVFSLGYSPIELLVNGTFPIGTGPMTFFVHDNQIHTIEVGSIFFADQNSADSNEPVTIDLSFNQLQSLQAGTFPLRNGPMNIYLSFNQISSIEPGTFVLPASTGADSNEPVTIELYYNQLQSLQAGTFPLRNGHMTIYLYNNQISSIEPGTFVLPAATGADSNEPITIDLSYNQLQSLQAGTFPLRNGPMYIYLYSNQIFSIEPGTFVLPAATDSLTLYLRLDRNELTTFDEAVFGSMMPFITTLYLYDNPLTCGCDIAWLILNEGFMATVGSAAKCADGTNLHDLDPQQYIDFC